MEVCHRTFPCKAPGKVSEKDLAIHPRYSPKVVDEIPSWLHSRAPSAGTAPAPRSSVFPAIFESENQGKSSYLKLSRPPANAHLNGEPGTNPPPRAAELAG
jgi:hypothetical protein